jgi:hypothetical protein
MAVELSVTWQDVNGLTSTERFAVVDAANAALVLPKLKLLSNAKIVSAAINTPLDITGLANNNAASANVETARTKMNIGLSGNKPAGATARPKTRLGIPAPVGSYINGLSGDVTNADIVALLANVVSNRGEAMTKVDRVAYSK